MKKVKELIDSLETPIELPQEIIISKEPETKPEETKEIAEPPKSSVLNSIKNKLTKKPAGQPIQEVVQEAPKKEETPKVDVISKKYEFIMPEEIIKFLDDAQSYNDTKKEILYEITRDLYKKYKVIWAKPTIKQFFDDIFYKR